MDLLGLVAGEEVIGYGYAVPVREQPHLHDGVGTVVLLRTALAVLRRDGIALLVYGVPLVVKLINVRMAYVEVIVRAVEVRDGHVPTAYLLRVLVGPLLQRFLVLCDYVQRIVDVIEGEAVEGLEEEVLVFEGVLLRARVQRTREGEQPEDLIRAELRFLPPRLPVPELIELQLLVECLDDAVPHVACVVRADLQLLLPVDGYGDGALFLCLFRQLFRVPGEVGYGVVVLFL